MTFDPVEGNALDQLKSIAALFQFRIADLLMQKGNPSDRDAFASYRGQSYATTVNDLTHFVQYAREAGYGIRRYKIEDTVCDSRIADELELLKST